MPFDKLLRQQPGEAPALVLPPFKAPAYATAEQQNMALFTRRQHPLYRDVTFKLLGEVINSRLFRTVRTERTEAAVWLVTRAVQQVPHTPTRGLQCLA